MLLTTSRPSDNPLTCILFSRLPPTIAKPPLPTTSRKNDCELYGKKPSTHSQQTTTTTDKEQHNKLVINEEEHSLSDSVTVSFESLNWLITSQLSWKKPSNHHHQTTNTKLPLPTISHPNDRQLSRKKKSIHHHQNQHYHPPTNHIPPEWPQHNTIYTIHLHLKLILNNKTKLHSKDVLQHSD